MPIVSTPPLLELNPHAKLALSSDPQPSVLFLKEFKTLQFLKGREKNCYMYNSSYVLILKNLQEFFGFAFFLVPREKKYN